MKFPPGTLVRHTYSEGKSYEAVICDFCMKDNKHPYYIVYPTCLKYPELDRIAPEENLVRIDRLSDTYDYERGEYIDYS